MAGKIVSIICSNGRWLTVEILGIGNRSTYTFFQRNVPMPEVGAKLAKNHRVNFALSTAHRYLREPPVRRNDVASP